MARPIAKPTKPLKQKQKRPTGYAKKRNTLEDKPSEATKKKQQRSVRVSADLKPEPSG